MMCAMMCEEVLQAMGGPPPFSLLKFCESPVFVLQWRACRAWPLPEATLNLRSSEARREATLRTFLRRAATAVVRRRHCHSPRAQPCRIGLPSRPTWATSHTTLMRRWWFTSSEAWM